MKMSRFIIASIAILITILSSFTIVYQSIAYVYVRTNQDTGVRQAPIHPLKPWTWDDTYGYASASATPSISDTQNTDYGIYSGYASVYANVGNQTPNEQSGGIWLRVSAYKKADGSVIKQATSSVGYSVYQIGDSDGSRHARASGHLY